MNPQTLARLTGVLFLITYVTSIPAFFVFYAPVLNDPGYITGAGPDTSVLVGAFLEVLLIIANIGTAVALFPVLKRQNEVLALGFVTARLIECAFIAVGILSLLTVVTLRQEAAGADACFAYSGRPGAGRDPRLDVPAGARLRRRRGERADAGLPDVPIRPGAAAHGRAGAHRRRAGVRVGESPCCSASWSKAASVQTIATMPEFFWELSLGIYLTVKGFRPAAAASQPARTATNELLAAV